jgi:hypothetical protein
MLLSICSPVFGEIIVSTSARYDFAVDNGSPETTGYALTLPLGLAYRGENFSLSVETAYGNAYVEDTDDAEASITSFTDTLLSAAYSYSFSQQPIALLFGLDINIPTGHENLSDAEESAEWGEGGDLFEVDNFGEGLNAGFSFGVMKQFDETVLAFQGAYVLTGEFDPGSDVDDDDLDPGDQLLFLGLVNSPVTSWLSFEWLMAYSYFWPDKTEGEENFQQGNQFVMGATVTMSRSPFTLTTSVQTTFPKVNKDLVEDELEQESDNSNGTDMNGSLTLTYTLSDSMAVDLQGNVRHYGASDLQDEDSGLPYSGQRIRYAGGAGVSYALNSHFSFQGALEVFKMGQEQDMFMEADLSYQGLNTEFSLFYTF